LEHAYESGLLTAIVTRAAALASEAYRDRRWWPADRSPCCATLTRAAC